MTSDLTNSKLIMDPPEGLEEMIDLYKVMIMKVIDKHALIKSKYMTERKSVPWYMYTVKVQAVHKYGRFCKRLWKCTSLAVNHEIFKDVRKRVSDLLWNAIILR